MASSGGRGRGYGGKNKDVRRPGHPAEPDAPTPPGGVSQRIAVNQHGGAAQSSGRSAAGSQKQFPQKAGMAAVQQYSGSPGVHVLNKPGEATAARKVSQEERSFCGTGSLSDENSQSVLYIDERFSFLIKQVSLLSSQDDGILTNQKLQHIEGILTKTCKEPQMLRHALDAISSAAILDARMATRISLMCCSMWFSHSQLLGQRLHHLFIEAMTDKIDGLEICLEGADRYLVNAAALLADIYTETKMLGAEELVVLARLIVQVGVELLECNTPLALRTLNVQLMQHGRKLYQCVPDKLEALSVSARKLLISRQPPAPACKIWLLLLSDQCLYKLEPLPKYLQDFYARHLDDSAAPQDAELQKERRHPPPKPDAPQDPNRGAKDPRGHKSDSSDRWSVHSNGDRGLDTDYSKFKDDVFEEKNPLDSSYDSSGVSDSNFSDNNEYYNANGAHSFGSERKPRPILGAGSRMVHNSSVKSDFDFNEPPSLTVPPGSNDADDLTAIPVFCPSVPPPNFVPRTKRVISAAQDSTDFWNTPPPPLAKAGSAKHKMDSLTPKMPQTGLSSRLDLNSWRQQVNGEEDPAFGQPYRSRTDSLDNNRVNYYSGNEKQEYSDDSKSQRGSGAGLLEKVKSGYCDGGDRAADLEWKKGWSEDCDDPGNAADYHSEKPILEDAKETESRLGRSSPVSKGNVREKKYRDSNSGKKYEPRDYKNRRNLPDSEENFDLQGDNFNKLHIDTGTLAWSKAADASDKSESSFDRNGEKARTNRSGAGRPRSDRRGSDTRQDRNFNRERKENDEKDSNWRRRDSDDAKNAKTEAKADSAKWGGKIVSNDAEEWNEDGGEVINATTKSQDDKKPGSRRDQRGSARAKRDPMEVSRSASYWTHDDRCDRDYDG